VPHMEQDLCTLPEHHSSSPVFSRIRVVRSLVFNIVFCASLFVFLSLFFWPLCCLSFIFWPLCCLSFIFWPLCCLSFFGLLFLIFPFGIFKLFLYVLLSDAKKDPPPSPQSIYLDHCTPSNR